MIASRTQDQWLKGPMFKMFKDMIGSVRRGVLMSPLILGPAFFLSAPGCQKIEPERRYEQIMIEAPATAEHMISDPHASVDMNAARSVDMETPANDLKWVVPQGWREIPGGGMRVISFVREDDEKAVDVSIVSLSGAAGGLDANLIRWGNQIGIDLNQDPQQLMQFIKGAQIVKTVDGLESRIFDFSIIQQGADISQKSMVASMVQINEMTVFVKMTGTIRSVKENLELFKILSRSVGSK